MAFGVPSIEDMTAYIQQGAIARGMDPNEALRVARSEGLQPGTWQSNVFKNGVREPSYGPFQLYTNGGLGSTFQAKTGLNPADPTTWRAGVDFALDSAKSGGWGPWYGAKKQGIVGMPTPYNGTYQPSLLAPPDPAGGGMLNLADPTVVGLPAAPAAAPAAYQAPGAPPPGIMNFLSSPMATGLASGLLMASGPSPTKIGLGQALGAGLGEMGKAQALAAANELKRDAISQQALSDQQTRIMNMMTMQGMIQAQQQKAQENKQALAQLQTQTSMGYNAADGGYKAAKELGQMDIGESLATLDPSTIHYVRQAIAAAKANGTGQGGLLSRAVSAVANPALAGLGLDISTPEGLAKADHAITLVETLNKQRSNLAQQLSSLAQSGQMRSAFALQNRLEGTGAEAGLAINEEMFSFMRDQIKTEAEAYGFHVGERPPEPSAKAPPSAAPAAPATDASGAPVLTPNSPLVTSTVPPLAAPRGGAVTAGATPRPAAPTAPQRFQTQQQAHDWAVKQPPGTYTVVIGGVTYPITVSP